MKKLLTVVAFAAATLSSAASAATVYQSLPDLTVAPVQASYCSTCNSFLPFRIYDTFTLGADAALNSVTFAIDTRTYNGSVNVGFFNLSGAAPGTAITDFTFADADFTYADTAFEPIKLVTASFAPLALTAGAYDISFYSPAGLGVPAYTNPGGDLYQSGNFFTPSQFYPDRSAAFSLGGSIAGSAVPEPSTWAMLILGFGLTGAAIRGARRRVVAA